MSLLLHLLYWSSSCTYSWTYSSIYLSSAPPLLHLFLHLLLHLLFHAPSYPGSSPDFNLHILVFFSSSTIRRRRCSFCGSDLKQSWEKNVIQAKLISGICDRLGREILASFAIVLWNWIYKLLKCCYQCNVYTITIINPDSSNLCFFLLHQNRK